MRSNQAMSYMDINLPTDYKPPRKTKELKEQDLCEYLKYSRLAFEQKERSRKNLRGKQQMHSIMRVVFRLTRVFAGISVVKINAAIPLIPSNRHVIYTISHVGKDDQAVFNELKTKHYTVLSGDYESLYNNIEGWFTKVNGVLFFDMNSKTERKAIVDRVAERLVYDDILCSMEGAWNISPNCLVYGIFPGMIKAALKSGAVIVPVGIERFNDKLYSLNVSDRYLDPSKEIDRFPNEKDFIEWSKDYIRQELASLKFNAYFHEKIVNKISCKRSEIGEFDSYRKLFVNDILKNWTFTEEDINRKRYRNPLEPEFVLQRDMYK